LSITIGLKQATGIYTFSGQVDPVIPGLQVTLARLSGSTKRVTGVSSTGTDAAGRYTIRTRLPAWMAGLSALTAPTSDHPPGRNPLHGLVVPTPRLANESVSQRSVRLEGAQYLSLSAFSRSGLIKQLQFEKFSLADATCGTDVENANWRPRRRERPGSTWSSSRSPVTA
jgi:hypothetical protein